ncbi:MAG: hemerythrin [Deltaproteobacteria bacterium]|nr:hemerythrin [Deltaproteobacteria bacterium]
MKATDELKKEHQGVELMLRILQAVSTRIERGEQIDSGHLDGMMEFFSIFVDKCHHGKEEEFLFPALEEAGVPNEGGPIGVMLSEHEKGRALVAKLREATDCFKSGEGTVSRTFQAVTEEYVALLTQHIEKENNVLYVMADARLDNAKDAELFEAFEKLEHERIGPGKHEEFHALLHQLRDIYLN